MHKLECTYIIHQQGFFFAQLTKNISDFIRKSNFNFRFIEYISSRILIHSSLWFISLKTGKFDRNFRIKSQQIVKNPIHLYSINSKCKCSFRCFCETVLTTHQFITAEMSKFSVNRRTEKLSTDLNQLISFQTCLVSHLASVATVISFSIDTKERNVASWQCRPSVIMGVDKTRAIFVRMLQQKALCGSLESHGIVFETDSIRRLEKRATLLHFRSQIIMNIKISW